MNPKWQFLHAFWEHRTKLLVLVLILSLIASQPIEGAIRHRLGRLLSPRSTALEPRYPLRLLQRYSRSIEHSGR